MNEDNELHSKPKEIARGAEATIFEDKSTIIKERTKKSYRHPDLDLELRSQRTKREASLLKKLKIPHPKLVKTDNKEQIIMEKINGQKIREVLDKQPELANKIGELVADLHNENIIHGDLTTSNMILNTEGKVILIDFGLSFQSHKIEDKAVDIHLFKQALDSKHFKVYNIALNAFIKGYSNAKNKEEILKRLKEVEQRGRYRKG